MSGLLQLRSVGDDLKCMREVQEIAIGNTCHFVERIGDQRNGWEAVFGQSRSYSKSQMLVTNLAEDLCMLFRNCGEAELEKVGTRTRGNVEMQMKEQLVILFTK